VTITVIVIVIVMRTTLTYSLPHNKPFCPPHQKKVSEPMTKQSQDHPCWWQVLLLALVVLLRLCWCWCWCWLLVLGVVAAAVAGGGGGAVVGGGVVGAALCWRLVLRPGVGVGVAVAAVVAWCWCCGVVNADRVQDVIQRPTVCC
jgi:hypothetical protein